MSEIKKLKILLAAINSGKEKDMVQAFRILEKALSDSAKYQQLCALLKETLK